MADSSRTIMTDAGFALETRVRADETKMQFTRATISTDDHFSDTDDALAKLTELSNIQQDGKVTAVQVINTTTVYVQVDVNQAESKVDYQMRSAALYAKDDDGTEVLYGVTVLQDPVFVHKDADGSYLGFGINTTVGKASNVVVVVDPANMVTQQVFEGTMKNYYTKAEVDAKFVTDDDFASKLPKNIATTDAANTFAKSQTLAGGATDGKGNAYATTKDVATGLNNGLSTKVTDNKNNTITANSLTYDLSKSGLTSLQLVNSGSFNDLPLGTVFAGTSMVDGPDKTHTFTTTTFYFNGWSGRKAQIAIADSVNLMYFRVYMGLHWNDWTLLSDDSKVVHTTDMRKPANDVAGIEEVNAKQDKIGYTPADDSKVVHKTGDEEIAGSKTFDVAPIDKTSGNPYITKSDLNNGLSTKVTDNKNNTITANDLTYDLSKTGITPVSSIYSGSFNDLPLGTVFVNNSVKDSPDSNRAFTTTTFYCRDWGGRKVQIAIADTVNLVYFRVCAGASWNSWTLLSDDSKVVHSTDMRKPAKQVASIDEVNAKQDKLEYTPANDADTFHRSPDTGAVTESGNFPALQVKGVDVATAADLKSIQLKMWHEIELPDMFVGSPILMKYNPDDQTTMILGAKNATLDDGASWTGTLFTLPEGFHWITTDSKMMPLYNMASRNDNVSGRLYNTKLSRNGSSSDGSKFGIWFTALSRSLISIDKPYTVVNSIQPD